MQSNNCMLNTLNATKQHAVKYLFTNWHSSKRYYPSKFLHLITGMHTSLYFVSYIACYAAKASAPVSTGYIHARKAVCHIYKVNHHLPLWQLNFHDWQRSAFPIFLLPRFHPATHNNYEKGVWYVAEWYRAGTPFLSDSMHRKSSSSWLWFEMLASCFRSLFAFVQTLTEASRCANDTRQSDVCLQAHSLHSFLSVARHAWNGV